MDRFRNGFEKRLLRVQAVLTRSVRVKPKSGGYVAVPNCFLDHGGVYVTRLKVNGRVFQSVTNVCNRPTFGEASFAVESHILNFEPIDLSESTQIELEFLFRLRSERQWPSPEALKNQIFKDVARAKRYFRCLGSMTAGV